MSITAKIYVEHERLALVPTLRSLDGVNIEVITQVTTDPNSDFFPFLIEYDDFDELERALDSDPTVENYKLVDRSENTGIYYIEHTEDAKLISTIVTEVNGFLMHTETKDRGWLVRLHLPDRQALNTVWTYANSEDIKLDIIEIYTKDGTDANLSYGLTEEQTEALMLAHEMGYFDEPREMSLGEIADEMGISSTALSGRIRRGMHNLISAALTDEDD